MLPPEYFDHKEDRLIELYRQLENFILKDITRRLLSAGEMTATTDRLIWKLKQMGESQAAIEQKLQKLTGLTQKELRSLLQNAVLTSWEDDRATLGQLGIELSNPLQNAAVIRVMDAEWKKSLERLENLTNTTINQATHIDLINMLDEADLRVAAGVQSYSAAVCDILDRYAGRGIYVDYPSGARRTLEAAVRLCVVTSMNQTAAQVTNQYIVEGGIEYVLVSAHLGARVAQKGQPPIADHSSWQGKAYKITGSEPGYPNMLESTGYRIDPKTGQGTVTNPLSLHGYNCRHSHKPWDPRLRNPYVDEKGNLKIDSEENKKRYELQQKQRAMERSLRAWKRKLIEKQEQINNPREDMDIDKLQQDYDRMAYQLTQKNKAYNDFCKQNDLQPQYDRIKVADFGREQTKQANIAARQYSKGNNTEEMFRKGSTHRKVENGVEIIDQPTYNKLIQPVLKNGGKVYRGTAEIEQHLEKNNASASTIGDVILFRKNVTVSDVLEETFHFKQNIQKRNGDKPLKEQIILNEIEAKEYVLSRQKKYHIPDSEVEQTRNQLESYKKELSEYYESQK